MDRPGQLTGTKPVRAGKATQTPRLITPTLRNRARQARDCAERQPRPAGVVGVLRIGLWITDYPFGAVPASPGQGLPLPTLSQAQAALCFAATPPAPQADGLAEVWLPTTTLQTLLNAAVSKTAAAAAKYDVTVNTLTVSTSPPNTVTVTADITAPGGNDTIGVTETLGTTTVSWETGDPKLPTQLTVPVVTKTTSFSSTDLVDDILEIIGALFSPLSLVFASVFAFNNVVAVVAAGDAATGVSGILGSVLSRLPYAIPSSC